MPHSARLLVRGALSLVIAALFVSAGCLDSGGIDIKGTEYRDPPDAPEFNLTNQHGDSVSMADFEGRVVVVAFIYTSCPDICLIISSNLDYVGKNLGEYSEEVDIISITIDPARDTVSHLSEWTEARGYAWDHLTSDTSSVMEQVWDEWKVVVDSEHIENSLRPENGSMRFAVLYPDNSTLVTDNECPYGNCFEGSGDEYAELVLREDAGVTYDIENGTIGNWSENETWAWTLYTWGSENETWYQSSKDLEEIEDVNYPLAWVASNANISNLPPGVDCNGHGWVMGSGQNAHCMCDDGWERPGDDWLSCVSEGSASGEGGLDPHDETLGEYEVGHSTVTFIIDKDQRKRVSYSGIMWDVDDFLQDVKALVDE
ncbi:MAG: hypothetical protein CMB61_03110 [Euryarchaeota archaeon]|nr:hypothetical protein [Euryarchaeota archaeon]